MPKGEKIFSPKQKDRTTTISKNFKMKDLFGNHKCLFFNLYSKQFQIGIYAYENKISKLISIQNPLES
jgi:hypothetical protein